MQTTRAPCSWRGRWRILLALILGLAGVVAHADEIITPIAATRTELRVLNKGVYRRDVLVITPRDVPGPRPALLMLSYLGGNPGAMATLTTAAKLARDHGFDVVLPAAVRGIWNYNPTLKLADDIGFLDRVIDLAITDFGADADRIYMAGYSNGGLMTFAYACARASRLAAAATVASTLRKSIERQCSPDATVPFVMFNGIADPLVPYDGNLFELSAPRTAAFWASANGCSDTPTPQDLANTVDDDTTVKVDRYTGCRDHATVQLYSIAGGGHTWPGTPAYQPALGRVGQDIDATDLLGRVLGKFTRP